ncbi:MAG: hypothetical protein K6F04_02340 [bacterium]|nr:hypothetical protein [bacterium]
MNMKSATEIVDFYLFEIESLDKIKSKSKRFDKLIYLTNKWANEEGRKFLSDTTNQYISELLVNYLEKYKTLTFKEKVQNFVKNFKFLGR